MIQIELLSCNSPPTITISIDTRNNKKDNSIVSHEYSYAILIKKHHVQQCSPSWNTLLQRFPAEKGRWTQKGMNFRRKGPRTQVHQVLESLSPGFPRSGFYMWLDRGRGTVHKDRSCIAAQENHADGRTEGRLVFATGSPPGLSISL